MIDIKNYQEYLSIIHNNDNKYIFIDFYAKWCKPCMKATPIIQKIEEGLTIDNILFYKVNIDEICEVVDECNVESIPKFSLYHKGSEIDCVCGFDIKKIGELLAKTKQPSNK
mgnify:CR=1 FL=1